MVISTCTSLCPFPIVGITPESYPDIGRDHARHWRNPRRIDRHGARSRVLQRSARAPVLHLPQLENSKVPQPHQFDQTNIENIDSVYSPPTQDQDAALQVSYRSISPRLFVNSFTLLHVADASHCSTKNTFKLDFDVTSPYILGNRRDSRGWALEAVITRALPSQSKTRQAFQYDAQAEVTEHRCIAFNIILEMRHAMAYAEVHPVAGDLSTAPVGAKKEKRYRCYACQWHQTASISKKMAYSKTWRVHH